MFISVILIYNIAVSPNEIDLDEYDPKVVCTLSAGGIVSGI